MSVDDRVVSASFETSKFQQGVQVVLNGLEKLKKALHFPDAGKGLAEVNAQAGKMNLSHIGNAIDDIKNRFTAMKVVALQVLGNIATKVVSMAGNFVKGFSFDPIMSGLHEYETNLNSIQTILANTQDSGGNLKTVNAALDELNTYSDKTIYNFSEMAKNIGTFTAAGVKLKPATAAIKGIANLAALSGSNSQQASTAMYQLSQAIASGRVGLQDWNSVVNAGMGGAVFQKALARTAENMGQLKKGEAEVNKETGKLTIGHKSFRDSISGQGPKWLTGEVLTETLSQLTGDMSDAELKAKGYTAEQIKAIQSTAKMAFKAATEVKTLSGVLDVAKESAGSGWAKTWQIIFGDFGEAKTLFTGLSLAISGFIGASADARNKVLGDWKKLGGRKILIDSLKIAFRDLVAVVKPIKEAFREIFPPVTGKQLLALTQGFRNLVGQLRIGPETAANLKRTFAGLFAIFDIGKQVIGGIFHFIKRLFDLIPSGNGSILRFTGTIGDWLVALDKTLKEGDKVNKFFDKIVDYIEPAILAIGRIKDAIVDFFTSLIGGDTSQLTKGLGDVQGKLTPMEQLLDNLRGGWDKFTSSLHNVSSALKPIATSIGEAFKAIGVAIADSMSADNFSNVMSALSVGLLGGIFVTIKKFMKNFSGMGGGLIESITGPFDALTGKLQAMQQNIKADTLMKIAIAIGVLAASVVALSLIDEEELNKALSAMAIGFGQLLGAMAILTNISKSAGFIKLPFIAASLILLGTSILILTGAMKVLSTMSWEELAKGLGGVAGLLAAISVAVQPLSKGSAGMIQAGLGITAIAIAMKILASAVKDFGAMSWSEIGKGLAAVAAALGAIGLASKLFPSGMVQIGVGLIAVAVGLKLLAQAVTTFGNLKWEVIGKGLATIGASLVIIGLAMGLMPPNILVTAAGLVVVGLALKTIASALKDFGGMSISEIAKGLGTLAASLIILGLALSAMSSSVAGAVALGIAAGAIRLLVPALESLGQQSWGSIIKGLVALGAALAVLGVAAALMQPVAPALLAMGAALFLIGGAFALVGAGVFLIGAGLSAIAVAGPAAILVLIKAFDAFLTAIPRFAIGVVMGLLQIVNKIAEVAPKFLDAFVKIISTLLDAVILVAPKLAIAINALISNAIKILVQNVPQMIAAGFKLLMALLTGIKNNISKVTSMVGDIVIRFLKTLTSKIPQLVKAGADLLVAVLRGVANNIGKVVTAAGNIITNFLRGIASNVGKVIRAGAEILGKVIEGIGTVYARVITAGGNVITKLLSGIGSAASRVVTKGTEIAGKFINAVAKALVKLVDTGATAIINFLNGLANVIRNREPEMIAAGRNVASAVIQGFIAGIGAADIISTLKNKFGGAIKAVKGIFKSHSPSEVFFDIGNNVAEGFALGIEKNKQAEASMVAMSQGIIDSTKNIFQITSPSKVMEKLGEYVGEGFAEGLMGTQDDITNAFSTLSDKLEDAMTTAKETVATERDKLRDLLKAKKKDQEAIKDARDAIKANNAVLSQAKAAHTELTKGLKDEQKELKGLSKDYQKITDQLEEATQKLKEATEARDNARAGFATQYGALPEIDMGTEEDPNKDPLGTFIAGLQSRTNAVAQYSATLAQLRSLGLNDRLYQKLLDDGTADQAFASQLLSGGATAVQGLNALDDQLASVSGSLATSASNNLYQAGVDSAQGLVNGLKSQQAAITKAMEAIATSMIKAIKKKLKIKSPSAAFAELGVFSMEGMAEGIVTGTKTVTDAADYAAEEALNAMQKSFTDLALADVNMDPTITPILDLSQVQTQAKNLSDMLNVVPITAAASYGQASTISADQNTVKTDLDVEAGLGATVMKFEQNNYSPTALSEADIYRQTKNQLSQAKAALP